MVPNGWEIKRIDEIADVKGGKRLPKGHSLLSENTGFPYVRVTDMENGSVNERGILYIPKNVAPLISRYTISKNDVFISVAGNGLGIVGIVPESLDGANLTENADKLTNLKINQKYLLEVLRSPIIQNKVEAEKTQNAQPKLALTRIKGFQIPVPPLPEQRKIAKILSTWDKVIATTEKLIETSKQQKKALMQQLLTGKKRLVNPDTGKAFEGEWEKTHLKPLLIEGKSRNKDNRVTRVLSVTNHSGFVLPEEQFSKRVASDNISNYKVVKKGQFGYNPSRLNVGSFACLKQFSEGVLSPMYVVFSTDDIKLQKEYLSYWMQSNEAKQRVKNSTQGSVRESVGFDALCSFPFILPSLDEQNKIISVLSAADKEIEVLEAKLAHFKQEKKPLMQQLLTGKRRVKVDEVEAA